MLETLAALPPTHLAYLITVIAAFSVFGVTLGAVHVYVNLKP
jgi:hypothetical protein